LTRVRLATEVVEPALARELEFSGERPFAVVQAKDGYAGLFAARSPRMNDHHLRFATAANLSWGGFRSFAAGENWIWFMPNNSRSVLGHPTETLR